MNSVHVSLPTGTQSTPGIQAGDQLGWNSYLMALPYTGTQVGVSFSPNPHCWALDVSRPEWCLLGVPQYSLMFLKPAHPFLTSFGFHLLQCDLLLLGLFTAAKPDFLPSASSVLDSEKKGSGQAPVRCTQQEFRSNLRCRLQGTLNTDPNPEELTENWARRVLRENNKNFILLVRNMTFRRRAFAQPPIMWWWQEHSMSLSLQIPWLKPLIQPLGTQSYMFHSFTQTIILSRKQNR